MRNDAADAKRGERFPSGLERIPFISFYAKTRGEAFVLSWFHRVAGVALVVFLWGHLLTSFTTPLFFASRAGLIVLSMILIYHSFNGGRLVLYEVFGVRNDESLIRWMGGLALLYILFILLLTVIGNQEVSPMLFWPVIFASSVILGGAVASRIRRTEQAITWKLQRMTGAFLLLLAPAHIIFAHLSLSPSQQAPAEILKAQEIFLRGVDWALLAAVLYHGGYGLISVLEDYVVSRPLRIGAALLIAIATAMCAVYGLS